MLLTGAVGLGKKEKVIGVIGAGGKTTFVFRLGNELAASGENVLITTTTHMRCPGEQDVDKLIFLDNLFEIEEIQKSRNQDRGKIAGSELLSKLPGSMFSSDSNPHRFFLAEKKIENGKVRGVNKGIVNHLKSIDAFRAVIVEADGAARKPIKSYERYEPVLPSSTDLVVVVVGIDALYAEFNEENVHRFKLAAGVVSAEPGRSLELEDFVKLVEQGAGKAREQAPGARIIAFINKVDSSTLLKQALPAGYQLFNRGLFQRVVIGSCQKPEKVLKVIDSL